MALVGILEHACEHTPIPKIYWAELDDDTTRISRIEPNIEFDFIGGSTNLVSSCIHIDGRYWVIVKNFKEMSQTVSVEISKKVFDRILSIMEFLCLPRTITNVAGCRHIMDVSLEKYVSFDTFVCYDRVLP